MAMLEVKDINVYYGLIHALRDVSFEVNEGEVVALIGANGAGKTTTLHTVTGLLPSKGGTVTFEGKDITHKPGHAIVKLGMSHVPEGRRVFAGLTVAENLRMGAYTRPKNEIPESLKMVYERFPRLEERKHQAAGTVSFTGWKKDDGTVLTGEQKLTADLTLHGVWTFTKKSSGGGGGGGHKPTVTIPDDVPTGLNGDDHYAYIVGYPNGNVEPNGNITRAEVATIFFRLLTEEVRTANSTQSNSLSDVTRGQWFNHAVSTLSSMGIVKGHNDGTFAPNAPITRAEFAAIAARFDDKNTDTSSKFTDIASHWAKNEIGIAANKGWINGYPDDTFRPNQYITRAEAMTLVNRVLNRLPENSSDLLDSMIKWPDNSDASAWYYLAVQEATNSHAYSDKSKDDKYEKWTTIRDARDWTELEK